MTADDRGDEVGQPQACAGCTELERRVAELGAELAEREGQVMSMARYVDAVAVLLEAHAEVVGSVRMMADMYKRTAQSVQDKRLADLAADLSGEPPPDDLP